MYSTRVMVRSTSAPSIPFIPASIGDLLQSGSKLVGSSEIWPFVTSFQLNFHLKKQDSTDKRWPALRIMHFGLFGRFVDTLLTRFLFAPACIVWVSYAAPGWPQPRSLSTGHLQACSPHSSPHPHVLTPSKRQELSHIPLDWKHVGQVSLQGQTPSRALLSVKAAALSVQESQTTQHRSKTQTLFRLD